MIIHGNKEILNGRLAVVLNSSQSKTPCGNDPWIQNTFLAVNELIDSGYAIVSSIGLLTWELTNYLANAANGRQVIVSPIFDEADGLSIFRKTLEDFQLDEFKTAMVFVRPDAKARSPKENWLKRDEAALSLAQRIFPLSIRPNGRLHKLLAAINDTKKIDGKFKIEYQKSIVKPRRYDIKQARDNFQNWEFITHWTRTPHGPWPGETSFSFYRRLVESKDEYPNNAFNTLLNIAREKKIRASSNKIRDKYPVIGFSEAAPFNILKLLRWCPRQVNWNFEPYGLALKRNAVEKLGIRPAIYATPEIYKRLPDKDKPFFQNRGDADVDWSVEKEWRHSGDLNFEDIAPNEIAFIVWDQDEKLQLESISRFKVLSFIAD